MAAIWIFGAGSNLGIYSITPLYLTKELHLNIGYANTILGVSRLGAVGVAIACGFLIDRFDLRKVMLLVMIVTSVFTVLLGMLPVNYTGIVLFLQASFVTGFFPVGLVAIAKTFSREMRSLATGIILAVSNVFGSGIVPYFLGISGDLHSFRLGITILGIFVALALGIYLVISHLIFIKEFPIIPDITRAVMFLVVSAVVAMLAEGLTAGRNHYGRETAAGH